MKMKSKPVSVRFGVVNWEWLKVKGGERRGRVAELVELAVTEMRQGMEGKAMKRKVKNDEPT